MGIHFYIVIKLEKNSQFVIRIHVGIVPVLMTSLIVRTKVVRQTKNTSRNYVFSEYHDESMKGKRDYIKRERIYEKTAATVSVLSVQSNLQV